MLLLVLVTVLQAPVAYAQGAEGQIKDLYTQGIDEYLFSEFDKAEQLFNQALEVANKEGISNETVARVHLAMGLLAWARFKDSARPVAESKARDAFLVAVTIDKEIKLGADDSTVELEALLEEARKLAGAGGAVVVTPPEKKDELKIDHKVVAVATSGEVLAIRARVPEHPDVFSVRVRYRTPEDTQYNNIEMLPSAGSTTEYVGKIPAEKVTQGNIAYYIEVLDSSSQVRAAAGMPAKPFRINIMGISKPKGHDFVMTGFVGAGIGVGLAEGESLNCKKTSSCYGDDPDLLEGVAPGMARSSLFVFVEAMFYAIPELQVGLYSRIQVEPETEAFMIGAKVRYLLFPAGMHRLYFGGALGYGHVRYLVNLGETFNDFTDVVEKGSVHIAPNLGYMVSFNDHVGLQLELSIPIHFPDFTFHIDVMGGPFFQF